MSLFSVMSNLSSCDTCDWLGTIHKSKKIRDFYLSHGPLYANSRNLISIIIMSVMRYPPDPTHFSLHIIVEVVVYMKNSMIFKPFGWSARPSWWKRCASCVAHILLSRISFPSRQELNHLHPNDDSTLSVLVLEGPYPGNPFNAISCCKASARGVLP